MIQLDYTEAIFAYLLLWIIAIALLWWRELGRVKRHDWELSNSRLFHCDHCHHSFIIKEPLNVIRCPKCNGMCFRRDRRSHR